MPNSEGTGLGQSQPAQAELAVGHCGTEVILCDLRLCVCWVGGVELETTALTTQCVLFLLSIAHSSRGFRASHCECQRPRDCGWVPCSHVPGEPTHLSCGFYLFILACVCSEGTEGSFVGLFLCFYLHVCSGEQSLGHQALNSLKVGLEGIHRGGSSLRRECR